MHQIILGLPIEPVFFDVTIMLEHLNFASARLFFKFTLQPCNNVLVCIKAASRKAEVVIAFSEQ